MDNEYQSFLEDINEAVSKRPGQAIIELKIIGYTALALAGLPERGTKDVDALEKSIAAFEQNKEIVEFLNNEFGKDSPGALRHGLYLDIVSNAIVWLPPDPRFIPFKDLSLLRVSRLDPTDTCVTKVFSNFQRKTGRGRDRDDIINALDNHIINFKDLVGRLDETLPRYETHAQAPEVFPRILDFIDKLQSRYGPASLRYKLPSWMENM